jgi:intracellular septation protein A
MLSRRSALFLLGAGIFQWVVWPTFLKNIWADPRSFDSGPTGFLVVHLVLTAVQLVLATVLLVLGWRGVRRAQSSSAT